MTERSPGDGTPGTGPLKVLMVIHSHTCGGAEMHVRTLLEGFAGRGCETFYGGPMDSWLGGQVLKSGIRHVHLPMRGFYDLYTMGKLALFVKRNGIDLIHGHQGKGSFYGGVASRMTGVPCVSSVHGRLIYKHFHRQRERKLIAVSAAVKDFLVSKGLPPDRIEVVHNGIVPIGRDEETRAAVRKTLGLGPRDFAIAQLARFDPIKDHETLLAACRLLEVDNWKLFLIGARKGKKFRRVADFVERSGLTDKVRFLGHRDDVACLLQGMDALAMPSRWEAMPLAVLEAMSAELPVVASRVGGIPEIITDGENGILFDAGDAAGLRNRMNSVAADDKLRQRISANAASTVRERFSVDRMLDRLSGLYEGIVSLKSEDKASCELTHENT